MKWAFNIRRKISAALLLTAIFVLLFVKNMMDNENVARLGTSFSSVYEDRLLVESYIYRMSEHLFRKKIMIDSSRTASSVATVKPRIDHYNRAISEIIDAYEKTRLTESEQYFFTRFKSNVDSLTGMEKDYVNAVLRGDHDLNPNIKDQINRQFNQASLNLDELSRIQISEGKLLNDHSQKIVAGSSLLTQFEIGILIAIGLVVLALVFESSTVFSKSALGKGSLN